MLSHLRHTRRRRRTDAASTDAASAAAVTAATGKTWYAFGYAFTVAFVLNATIIGGRNPFPPSKTPMTSTCRALAKQAEANQ